MHSEKGEEMDSEFVEYFVDEAKEKIPCKGFLTFDSKVQTKRPGVLVVHAYKGQDDFARKKAIALAELGYVSFAVDLYGNGTLAQTDEEAKNLMIPLFIDRQSLRQRITAAYETLANHPLVDPDKIGAIGFCFGGLTVLELFRSGAKLSATACFHSIFCNTFGGKNAALVPNAAKLFGSLLILHGADDPFVSTEDIKMIQKEFTEANVDWEMNIYGQTAHSFTDPDANDKESGIVYNSIAARRSWQAMCQLFKEVF